MTEREKKYLSDIIHSIRLIKEFTSEINSFKTYSEDLKTQSAVERQLVIVGEAVNKFLKESESYKLDSSKQIIKFKKSVSSCL